MNNREIDALVAEHVMGNDVRPYSTVIQAAWSVVEKMRAEKFGFKLECGETNWNERSTWFAGFGKRLNPVECEAKYVDTIETAPMSICLAALRAKGVEVEGG